MLLPKLPSKYAKAENKFRPGNSGVYKIFIFLQSVRRTRRRRRRVVRTMERMSNDVSTYAYPSFAQRKRVREGESNWQKIELEMFFKGIQRPPSRLRLSTTKHKTNRKCKQWQRQRQLEANEERKCWSGHAWTVNEEAATTLCLCPSLAVSVSVCVSAGCVASAPTRALRFLTRKKNEKQIKRLSCELIFDLKHSSPLASSVSTSNSGQFALPFKNTIKLNKISIDR